MAERQQALLNAIMKDPAVASIGSAIGAGGGNTTVNNGRIYIALKPYKQRDSMETMLARLRTNLAKIQGITLYMQAAQDITIGGRVSKTQYQYTLGDADPGELNHWAALFLDRIKKVPGITDVATDQLNSGPLLDITIKREVASSYGILPFTIDNTLDDAFGQRIVSTMYTALNQYHVVMEVNPKFQYSPEALTGIYVKSSTGQEVPLSTLVDSVVKVAPLVVNHQGQFPSVTISFNLLPGTAIGEATTAIQHIEQQLGKPLSLQTSFQGNAQAFGDSLSTTPILIAAALFVIYLILGILYESLIHPITIISTLPSAGLGALLLLMAAHLDLSVIAIVGIILLIGIVKKNGIMLVDFALHVGQQEGLTAEEAIYRACIMRFRPILMTTMAAMLAGVPMMLGTGAGSEIRQPLGYAIVGGLAVSQLLTLYTTPVVYIYLDRLQTWLFGKQKPAIDGSAKPDAGRMTAIPAAQCSRRARWLSGLVVARRRLIRNAVDRAFVGPDRRPGHRLDHFARAFGIVDPFLVEVVGAGRDALRAFAGIDHAGIAAMQQLEEMVLRLAVAARIADQALRQSRVLDAVFLLAGLAQRAAVEADDRGVAEVGIDAVEAGGIGDRDIDIVGPGHRLGNQDLLFLGRIHVALAAHDQFGALHGAVAPDFRKVAVVADDQADLQTFRAFGHVGAIAGIPAFDRHPRHDLAVLLDDLALVVHQDQGVVRRLVRMLLVALAGEREHAPDFCLAAGFGKDFRLGTRDLRGGLVHLLGVVHDAVGGIFREDHEIHARQTELHADDHVGDLAGIVEHLGLGVQPRHLVIDDGDADRVVA